MSDRTVADDTLTPGASTTCWDPTGWAEPMYSATTALRMAALRASSSPAVGGVFASAGIGGGHRSQVWGSDPLRPDRSESDTPLCWHSTLVSAEPSRTAIDRQQARFSRILPPAAASRGQAVATNIRLVMAGPRAMLAPSTSRVSVPSGARAWIRAVVPGVSPWSPR